MRLGKYHHGFRQVFSGVAGWLKLLRYHSGVSRSSDYNCRSRIASGLAEHRNRDTSAVSAKANAFN